MSYKSKRKKNFPCIRCDEHVKINEYAVKCALCDLWVHKICERMTDETFNVLDMQSAETGQCFWSCKSCRSYALKFDKRMRDIEKRVQVLEEKVPDLETDLDTAKADIVSLQEQVSNVSGDKLADQNKNKEEVTTAVFEEFRERESRRCNLIIHNLAEPGPEIITNGGRKTEDKNKLQELCGVIDVDLIVDDVTRFVKRLGKVNAESSSPRPMLVGFKTTDQCTTVLNQASNLSDCDEPWKSIHIVRDLTKAQRKEERTLLETVEKRNAELTKEESEHWIWKVVGRRGEWKMVKAAVEVEEADVEVERVTRGRGRGRSRGRGRRNRQTAH